MAQQAKQRPSDLLQIRQHVEQHYRLDGWWTAIQVDHAVYALGNRIENKLNELDKKGKPKHTLERLLHKPEARPMQLVTRLSRNNPLISPKPKVVRHA